MKTDSVFALQCIFIFEKFNGCNIMAKPKKNPLFYLCRIQLFFDELSTETVSIKLLVVHFIFISQ